MKLVLAPIGPIEPELLDWCKNQLQAKFDCEVTLADGLPIPDRAFNKTRMQYVGDAVLEELGSVNVRADRIVGLIDRDCYVQGLNFILVWRQQAESTRLLHCLV